MSGAGKTQRTRFSIWGYCGFFVQVVLVASCSILVYSAIENASGDIGLSAGVTFANILVLTGLCVLIDALRRKIMVERPVREILDATERITSGDFTVRLRPSHTWGKYDEYDVIKENLNRMAAELSKTELLRSDFVADVSHEIKTPLSVIQNYADALKNERLSAELRREYAETLTDATKKLADLVGNILKLNKLENRELPPEQTAVELGESLRQNVLPFVDLCERKGLELDCEIDDVTVVSDETLLEIVWNNLLSNAVKFTERGGRISVTLNDEGERAVVRIRDSGCGISPEIGSHIFEKFFQGDASHAREGNGLGLALVKKAIDAAGGEISVESRVGEGSVFTVALRKGTP